MKTAYALLNINIRSSLTNNRVVEDIRVDKEQEEYRYIYNLNPTPTLRTLNTRGQSRIGRR